MLNSDATKVFGTFFAIPADRPEPASKPEVRFMEVPAGAALPIRTWWYPGESTGFEFIYPKQEARLLAKDARQSVLTTQAQTTTTAQTDTKELSRISSSGQETNVDSRVAPTSAVPSGDLKQGDVASPTDDDPVRSSADQGRDAAGGEEVRALTVLLFRQTGATREMCNARLARRLAFVCTARTT